MNIEKNDNGTVTITAPVLVPGARDCDYTNGETPLTREQIKEFAKSYEKYQFIDHEHGLTRNGNRIGEPVKSFLLTQDTNMTLLNGETQTYPAGSWFITSNLTDPQAIQTALDGGYTGYSVSIFSQNRADEYLAALKSKPDTPLPTACKSINSNGTGLIKDVIDPVVLSVSLVKTPCLHESKFCKLNGDTMEDDVISLKSKLLSAMGMSEEAEVIALKSQVTSLEETINAMKSEFDSALKSMQEEFKTTLEEALKPVEPEALKAEEENPEEEVSEEVEEVEETEEETTTEEETDDEEEVIAEKGHSKAEPVHDNIIAEKSKPQNIYEALGRNPDGTRKLQ